MTIPVTQVVVKDMIPEIPPVTVGYLYACPDPQVVFRTEGPQFISAEDPEEQSVEEADTKVLARKGRRPAPPKGVETK